LAFPSPNAFAASLITRATLSQRGIDIKPLYVKTHSNVYRSVLQADVVAGGAVNNTWCGARGFAVSTQSAL
jgi:phosphonate transport system substrate-binding protein